MLAGLSCLALACRPGTSPLKADLYRTSELFDKGQNQLHEWYPQLNHIAQASAFYFVHDETLRPLRNELQRADRFRGCASFRSHRSLWIIQSFCYTSMWSEFRSQMTFNNVSEVANISTMKILKEIYFIIKRIPLLKSNKTLFCLPAAWTHTGISLLAGPSHSIVYALVSQPGGGRRMQGTWNPSTGPLKKWSVSAIHPF